MVVVVLNMREHSSFQDMLFPMLFISKYAKSYASIMDTGISLPSGERLNLELLIHNCFESHSTILFQASWLSVEAFTSHS